MSLLESVQPSIVDPSRSIVAIDPGTHRSAMCLFYAGRPVSFETSENADVLRFLREAKPVERTLVVEMIQSFGMPVGREIFETCVWIGRFVEAWGGKFELVYRQDVKLHLCKSARAKDSNVAQALRDRFGEKGTKKAPGVLYGIRGDEWAALAVAVTYWDKMETEVPTRKPPSAQQRMPPFGKGH